MTDSGEHPHGGPVLVECVRAATAAIPRRRTNRLPVARSVPDILRADVPRSTVGPFDALRVLTATRLNPATTPISQPVERPVIRPTQSSSVPPGSQLFVDPDDVVGCAAWGGG